MYQYVCTARIPNLLMACMSTIIISVANSASHAVGTFKYTEHQYTNLSPCPSSTASNPN